MAEYIYGKKHSQQTAPVHQPVSAIQSKPGGKLFGMTMIMSVIGSVVILVLAISCATIDRVILAPPMIPGAKYVGMESCGVCHEKQVKDFKLTGHSRLQLRVPEGEEVAGLACEACHGPGSLHMDAGGEGGVHILSGKQVNHACMHCHLEVNAQFSLQHRHPLKEGLVSCSDCHNAHGADIKKPKGMAVARTHDECAKCHREQARPRVFEHEAMREGCSACHNPHGSINEKLLTERDNNLCLKCHAQVANPGIKGSTYIGQFDHTPFLRRGTCWSAGCHGAVHGSDVNSHLRY
jgi:predicted CXXCH cytochrome family protein